MTTDEEESDLPERTEDHPPDVEPQDNESEPTLDQDGPAQPWWARLAKNAGFTIAIIAAMGLGFAIGDVGSDEEVSADEHSGHVPEAEADVAWTCSMHPQIRMQEPGQCPICGMDLVPDKSSSNEEHGPTAPRIALSANARALATIQTTPVTRTEPRAEVRLLGRVDYDETRLRMVTPWTDGRIDRLKVRVTGAKIRKGQVVAFLYSPEVYAGMRDLVVAIEQSAKLSKGMHGSSNLAAAAVSSSREKLRLLGVSEAQIKSIEKTRTTPKQIPIRSTFAGTVIRRNVEEGDYVKAGTPLYHVADLSRVWVQIDAYESDLPHLGVGQAVSIEIESLPDEAFEGTVAFIDPTIDKKTRTARVRVEVANAGGQIRPGMFAQALIEADLGDASSYLVIPRTAALFTGRRSIVYVEVAGEPGVYELREVRLGPAAGPVFPVLAGLAEGESVVTRGAFVLDADLQLSGGRSMMTMSDDRGDEGAPTFRVTGLMLTEFVPILNGYFAAQNALATDDFEVARVQLEAVAAATNEASLPGPRTAREAWQGIASPLAGHARHAATAKEQRDVRSAFELLSLEVLELLRTFGNPTEEPLRVAFCPMAFDDRGAPWVQREEQIANPYYGARMLRCGEIKATLLPGERLAASLEAEPPAPTAAMAGHNH